MVVSIGRAMGVEAVSEAFTDQLYAFSGGHPSLARLIAGKAYEARATPARLDEADLAAGLETLHRFDEIGSFFKQNLWLPMTPAEQELILAVALQGEQAPVNADPESRASLLGQGILAMDAQGRPSIPIDGFREWLLQRAAPVRRQA